MSAMESQWGRDSTLDGGGMKAEGQRKEYFFEKKQFTAVGSQGSSLDESLAQ
jgi:hypothetical protein